MDSAGCDDGRRDGECGEKWQLVVDSNGQTGDPDDSNG